MSNKNLIDSLNYEVGDEVWWFRINHKNINQAYYVQWSVCPGEIELVHDIIKEIKEDHLILWHSTKSPSEIWGKTRKEAWKTLKEYIQKWGELE